MVRVLVIIAEAGSDGAFFASMPSQMSYVMWLFGSTGPSGKRKRLLVIRATFVSAPMVALNKGMALQLPGACGLCTAAGAD